MRTIEPFKLFLPGALMLWGCAHQAASPPPAAEPAAQAEAPASEPAAAYLSSENHLDDLLSVMLGGRARTAVGKYRPDVFSEIFGDDKVAPYLDCGAVFAAEADYGAEHFVIVDMGTPLGARCIYDLEKTLDGKPMPEYAAAQSEGYRRPGAAFLRRGRYYIKGKGSQGSFGGGKLALVMLRELASKIATEGEGEAEAVKALPMLGRIPGSDKYIPRAVFGLSSLPRAFAADYGCGDAPLGIAHVIAGAAPDHLLEAVQKEATKKGYAVSPWRYGQGSYKLSHPGKPNVFLLKAGNQLGALEIEGDTDRCDHVVREFQRILQKEKES